MVCFLSSASDGLALWWRRRKDLDRCLCCEAADSVVGCGTTHAARGISDQEPIPKRVNWDKKKEKKKDEGAEAWIVL